VASIGGHVDEAKRRKEPGARRRGITQEIAKRQKRRHREKASSGTFGKPRIAGKKAEKAIEEIVAVEEGDDRLRIESRLAEEELRRGEGTVRSQSDRGIPRLKSAGK
jgi:hypothetical protein